MLMEWQVVVEGEEGEQLQLQAVEWVVKGRAAVVVEVMAYLPTIPVVVGVALSGTGLRVSQVGWAERVVLEQPTTTAHLFNSVVVVVGLVVVVVGLVHSVEVMVGHLQL